MTEKYSSQLTKQEKQVILDKEWKVSYFYILPKISKCKEILTKIETEDNEYIHMDMPETLKGRPINAGTHSITKGCSKLLDKILTPLVSKQKSYIKDEWDFLRKFPHKIDSNTNIFTCDVISLYTSIPHDLGLRAIEYWLDKYPEMIPERFSKDLILEFVKFVLKNNYCEFDKQMWHQLAGTAMGADFASPYACLTIGYLEETILFPILLPANFTSDLCDVITEQFYRYVDDGINLIPAIISKDKLLSIINSMNPAIQYTIGEPSLIRENEQNVQKIIFLGIMVLLSESGNITTDVYYKDTNSHDYLNFHSHHPRHITDNIPYALAKRIIVFTTDVIKMEKNLDNLRNYLLQCVYELNVINK